MAMKTYICSDLHCEFHPDGGRELIAHVLPDADLIVVAGDLSVAGKLRPALELLAKRYPHVVYVAGNHDYYHSSLEEVERLRPALGLDNVYWLEDEVEEVAGVRFVGCTLWFGRHRAELEAELSDYHVIAGFRQWVLQKNERSLEFLRRNVTPESVVVTHHLPSRSSTLPRYRDSALNCFFVCPGAEEILLKQSPRLWIHGHTHESLDYRLGRTRVFCNPLGYAGVEVNPFFKAGEAVLELQAPLGPQETPPCAP
jgi:predicted phosphodiesterase